MFKSPKAGGASSQTDAERSSFSAPNLSLPKGGGAIRGMSEKFAANPVTGTGSMSVPIATSPGRSGFGPELSLSYDSASGNSIFGFGWSLSLPSITRKTDKGLPRYWDAEESDVFILSSAEDLVPVLSSNGNGLEEPPTVQGYVIKRYRPRIEGLFARIERWSNVNDQNDVHWRSISKDNILTLYGKDNDSRIYDPDVPQHIFSWLICETRDDKGNAILYEYRPEDGAQIDLNRAHERNRGKRDDPHRNANRYLKHIRYGNRVSLLDDEGQRPLILTSGQIQSADWMFEIVFDYGEHDADVPKPNDLGLWSHRVDSFFSHRAGFEVRTCRLCQRVLMFHHFEGEANVGKNCLVRSTDFTYFYEDQTNTRSSVYTFLRAVTQTGYMRMNGGYIRSNFPPIEYQYSLPIVQDTVQEVDAASLEHLPIGLDGVAYQWTDLHGEGIPGILTEQVGAWFYKRNVSPISNKLVEFAPLERVAVKPNVSLASGLAQFMDLAGDGQPDLVVLDGPMPGFYEHDGDEGWQSFRPFTSRLNRDTHDPNLKFVDLNGDGHADVLITEDQVFTWHPSLAEDGFGQARHVSQSLDEEKGPHIVFADVTQAIYLADMCGDSLTDIVRIRNGEVCYWPNLGYGRFGAKITMDASPYFDNPDQFNHKRIRLADIDGSGTTDIIYLHRDGVCLYFNQCGNSWSKPQTLKVFPRLDDLVTITLIDLLGNGTACLVWSSPLLGDAGRQMRYVNLMGDQKPHLLIKAINNLGAETRVNYAPTTRFYLQDKRDGKSWITRLPFPVHVVERVETYDHISGNRFVTRYKYHHGYFDGVEREFRGFGMVEQWDTEEFAALTDDGTLSEATNLDAASHVPPVMTKTWFHTGIYVGRDRISNFFAGLLDEKDQGEYYREPAWPDDGEARLRLLPDTIMPTNLSLAEEREACRALKGAMLRQEVYALDGTATNDYPNGHPYTVTEQNFTIQRLQKQDGNRHAVFFTHPREVINYHYERNPADPRISHALTLEVDTFGSVLRSLAIGYPRANVPERQPKQNETHITLTLNRVANRPDQLGWYRAGLPVETRTYEVTKPPTAARRFTWEALSDLITALVPLDQHKPPTTNTVPYEQWDWREQWDSQTEPGGFVGNAVENTRLRLIEHVRIRYRKNNLTALLPLAMIESLALPGESYKLALTPGLLAKVFKRKRAGQPDEDLLPNPTAPFLNRKGPDQGAYFVSDGDWWIPSGRVFFDPVADVDNPALTAVQELSTARQHFYLAQKVADPFGHSTIADYDTLDLLVTRTSDALDNTVTAVNDYRVLQPYLMTDPNGNRTQVAFDALGMVVATAVMGKQGENVGDLLEGFDANPPLANLQNFIADPQNEAAAMLGRATTRLVYDLDRYQRTGQPPFTATLARETHFKATGGPQTKIQISFTYSDGFGREIQKKIQAEGGAAPERQAPVRVSLLTDDIRPGDLLYDAQGDLIQNSIPRRWVGSGRTVFNNKGKSIRQYEPFFSATHLYEPEREMTDTGVSPILFYDPVERVVATVHPNHTYEKVVFDAWQHTTYDVNDTVTFVPSTDDDVMGFFIKPDDTPRISTTDYLPTWYEQRIGGPPGDPERDAAQKAAVHANTPTVAHLDALGRPFITIADNGTAGKYETRVELDIESNQRAVIDANDRVVMRYNYDMLGNRIHQASMEAGERWTLNDVAGKPIHAWDSRKHEFIHAYDNLRRPTESRVKGGVGVLLNNVYEKILYGEGRSLNGQTDRTLNLRGKPFEHYDTAGKIRFEKYDFKGNLSTARRWLSTKYKEVVQWDVADPDSALETEDFPSGTEYDALNRPVTVTTSDGSVYRPTYNEANLLNRVDVALRGTAAATPFVTNIDYNAKGQRTLIEYGNGVKTEYDYDPDTFRLTHLKTTRTTTFPANQRIVQDLSYTYDPVGNITRIRDDAQQTIYFRNKRVEPSTDYSYDAIYRLIKAEGREHLGQNVSQPIATAPDAWNAFHTRLDHPGNGNAMGRYSEEYVYDAVDNIFEMNHHTSDPIRPDWTRNYAYNETSLIEDGTAGTSLKTSNRLSSTTVNSNLPEAYTYDAHGNMTLPHLPLTRWDYRDQLQATAQQVINNGMPETTWYVYDAGGQRVRKVTENVVDAVDTANGIEPRRKQERIYLGGFEIYRGYENDGVTIKLERETLHVMDDKQRIAIVETKTKDTGVPTNALPVTLIRYQYGNHLGSASLELDDAAAVISYEEYYPYGSTSYQAGRTAAEVSLKRYRYTGKERDEETGFYYHGARYYASWLGRWTSCDPAGARDGLMIYGYVQNNPLRLYDGDGRTAAEFADQWQEAQQKHLYTGEQVSSAVSSTGQNMGNWLSDRYGVTGAVLGAVVATATDVVGGIAGNIVDPTAFVRGVLRIGVGSGEGMVDIERGRVLEGSLKITADVATAFLTVVGVSRTTLATTRTQGLTGNLPPKLDWSRVNKKTGQTTPAHVMEHGVPKPLKASHGVFRNDPVDTTNKAYRKAVREGLPIEKTGISDNLNVRMKNAGTQSGKTPQAQGTVGHPIDTVTIALEKGVNRSGKATVRTAFPKDVSPQGSTLPYVATPIAGAAVNLGNHSVRENIGSDPDHGDINIYIPHRVQ